jgi:hypothetical protein
MVWRLAVVILFLTFALSAEGRVADPKERFRQPARVGRSDIASGMMLP